MTANMRKFVGMMSRRKRGKALCTTSTMMILDRTAVAEDSRTGKAYQPDNTAVTEERLSNLRSYHCYINALRWYNLSEMDIETMSEHKHVARLKIRLD